MDTRTSELSVWLRGNKSGSRDYTLKRITVMGLEGIQQRWGGVDEYAAVFSEKEIQEEIFNTIFVDIDAHSGEDIGKAVNDFLARAKVCPSRMYFTGRGCHAYFDLEEPVRGRERYKKFCKRLIEEWGVSDIVDNSVVGDVRRMARLPGSRNGKNGLMMIMIPAEWTDSIYKYSRVGRSMVLEGSGKVNLAPDDNDEHEGKDKVREIVPIGNVVWNEGEWPPCIRMAARTLIEVHELDHLERIHLGTFLLAIGREDKLWELLRYANDFGESISGYHINYLKERIKNGTMNCLKCSSVPASICPYIIQSQCVYFPSVNHSLRRRADQPKSL